MNKIELHIVALSHHVTQSHNYAVVLGEKNGNRRLPIMIGAVEAQAIVVAIEGMVQHRPLTHDLFKNTLEKFDIELVEIAIVNYIDGIFYASLICKKDGEFYEVDSRTSDALAMAARFECPIYTNEEILQTAGLTLSEDEQETESKESSIKSKKKQEPALSKNSIEKLQQMLEDALEQEDYEKAAKIRDEINNRK